MRAFLFLFIFSFLSIHQIAYSQKNITLKDATDFSFELLENQKQGFKAVQRTGGFNITTKKTKAGTFSEIRTDKLMKTFRKGYPDLPVVSKLIDVPIGADINVKILSYDVEIIDLNKRGIKNKLAPAQPSREKSSAQKPDKFYFNKKIYNLNKFTGDKLVKVEDRGVMRNARFGRLQISPLKYNPAANKLKIYNNLKFEVQFSGYDNKKAEKLNKQYSNSYFDNIREKAVNYLSSDEKGLIDNAPITYVIVSDSLFKTQLQPFIRWKEQKGFNVITAYTNDIGKTTSEIKSYLENLYNNPNPTPPSFVLFVGDVGKVPAWNGNAGSHVTDLYYCEYTGDNLPEVYYGRFSAQTKDQLQPQIEKTLEYEKYKMSNPEYLNQALLVAGDDETWEDVYGNGAMWYADNYYFNSSNDINSHLFLQDPPNGNGAVSDSIFRNVNEGVGYANYTAHCNSSGWSNPSFKVSDVGNLSNDGKYGLWVGNCCLSVKFDDNECLGEASLRANNSGAIGYIGGSNNTYWDEDYWWGVGNIASPVKEPTYSETGRGVYDGMFHTKSNEANDPSTWYMTQSQAITCGNLAIDASTSSRKQYYWEIYHLMGDPSLMPYLGVPEPMNVTTTPSALLVGMNSLKVNTAPYAYVALSFQGSLLDAKHTGQSGDVTLNFDSLRNTGIASLVVTAQNKQPYIDSVIVKKSSKPFVALDSYSIVDSAGNNNGNIDFGETIALDVVLENLSDSAEAVNISDSLSADDPYVSLIDKVQDYGSIKPYSDSLIRGAFSFKVNDSVPDQHNVGFLMDITGYDTSGTAYTWQSKFNITINAPKLKIGNLAIDDLSSGDGDRVLDPGETANLLVAIENTGHSNASLVSGVISSSASDLTINEEIDSLGSLPSGSMDTLIFNVRASETALIGTKVNIQIDASAGDDEQYLASANNELIIGKMPAHKISEEGTVTSCAAYFYDSGADTTNYANDESHTITFRPGESGKAIQAIFTHFSIEENNSDGDCYDKLYAYDGSDTDANLIGTYCNSNPADTITATNQSGELTFQFISDGSVTKPGWQAEITCIDRNEVIFSVSDGKNPLEDVNISCNGYDLSTNKEGLADLWLESDSCNFVVHKNGYRRFTDTIDLNSDTTIQIALAPIVYDVEFEVYESTDTSEFIPANITFDDTTKNTLKGNCLFENVDYSGYSQYFVESKGYVNLLDSFKVNRDTTLNIGLEPKSFNVSVYVKNEEGKAISDVNVEVEKLTGSTNESGYVGFVGVPGGERTFYAEKEGYSSLEENNGVFSDSTYNLILSAATDVKEVTESGLIVYPNPANEMVYIEKNRDVHISYEIIDLTGKTLQAGELLSPLNEINVSSWSDGIYFIRFNFKQGVDEYKLLIE